MSRKHQELFWRGSCGRLNCLEGFKGSGIDVWLDEMNPLCPRCGVDSALGELQGYDISKDALAIRRERSFGDA
jgi:hypothetical protein